MLRCATCSDATNRESVSSMAEHDSDRHPGGMHRAGQQGDAMRAHKKRRGAVSGMIAKAAVAGVALVTGCVTIGGSAGAATSSAPGVTANSITVGTISTQTGPIASNFSSLIYGEKAYFDYIDAQGGINGRKIDYKYAAGRRRQRDDVQPAGQHADQPGPRVRHHRRGHRVVHAQLLRGGEDPHLRLQRHRELGRPAQPLRRRRIGASTIRPRHRRSAYVAKRPRPRWWPPGLWRGRVGRRLRGRRQGSDSRPAYKVGYTDYKIAYPGTTVATDVQRMKQAGVDLVISCMDVQGNINLARAVQQYGLKTMQLWLNGNDQSTLQANESLMQGVYFDIQHVPFTAPTSSIPGSSCT